MNPLEEPLEIEERYGGNKYETFCWYTMMGMIWCCLLVTYIMVMS